MTPFKDLLFEAMQPNVATTIFAKYGIRNAAHLDKGQLRKYYMALVKRHHSDVGGNDEDMKWINAAYDVLKKNAYDVLKSSTKSSEYDAGPNGWAQAGWSGGIPFTGHISHETFGDLNFCKKTAWEISGKPPFDKNHEYTFRNWDGNFFRGSFSVYAVPEKLFDISKMMVEWDSWNHSAAVFVTQKNKPNKIYVINVKGHKIDPPKELEHDSFNSNPGNDNSFVSFLQKNFTR